MARKVRINGEVFEFDPDNRPMTEALALEEELKTNYGQWESGLQAGSARAIAGLVWLVWRRAGREVAYADIISGKVEVDLASIEREDAAETVDPTGPGPDASSSTGAATSASSLNGSGSSPGSSGSSKSGSSRRSLTTSNPRASDQG